MTKTPRILLLAVLLATAAAPTFAQSSDPSTTGTAGTTVNDDRDDRDFPWGLLGLIGLAGLTGRKRDNVHHDRTQGDAVRR